MQKWKLAALASSLFAASLAWGVEDEGCEREALRDSRVPVEAKKKLERMCERSKIYSHCVDLSNQRKLQGDARITFLQKCSGMPPPRKR
jgi:hypothetical protein